jgi:hypothetical protein
MQECSVCFKVGFIVLVKEVTAADAGSQNGLALPCFVSGACIKMSLTHCLQDNRLLQ